MRNRLRLAAALVLLPGALAAQSPQERIEAALLRAAQAGIPIELLESKLEEGRAKGVPIERIAAAVEARGAALEQAHGVLHGRGAGSPAELSVGADALQSGVSQAVLAAVADRAPGERRTVAIAALTQLVQLGHAPEHALQRVTEALARGPEALINLPAQAQAEKRQGGPPGQSTAPGQNKPRGGPPSGVPAQGQGPQSGRPKGRPAGSPGG